MLIANWKMNGHSGLAQTLLERCASLVVPKHRVVVCPPFPYLALAHNALAASAMELGAQTVSAHEQGAHTGEVSASMLQQFDVSWVIVGHSERRAQGESAPSIRDQISQAQKQGLGVVLCLGEPKSVADQNQSKEFIDKQLRESLPEQCGSVVIAYEPIWAIGTGHVPTVEGIESMVAHLRLRMPGSHILYGGSVNADNLGSLLSQTSMDGALVGGASLQPEAWAGMINTYLQLRN